MTGLERTERFINGKGVDRPPFHPILMQFSAQYGKVNYRDYCLNPRAKAESFLKCARDFSLDWVTVMSDPYTEAEAFGLKAEYPEDDLPLERDLPLKTTDDFDRLELPNLDRAERFQNVLKCLDIYRTEGQDRYFITGWVEGPMAELADLRGVSSLCMDLVDIPGKVHRAMDIIIENAKRMITLQVKTGARCIGIGDAAASLIGPAMYEEFVFEREKALVQHIHSLGAYAKIHICGDTRSIQKRLLDTGCNILDVDHLNGPMTQALVESLGPSQVFSGNSDPVGVIMQGSTGDIARSVRECYEGTGGMTITSAGCEIPKQTSLDNFRAYCKAAAVL